MARAEVIWPYVEKTLVEFLGDRVKPVGERVLSVQHGSSRVLVRLVDSEAPRLQVFSPMLHGVEKSAELLGALNELNAGLAFAKIFWMEGDVMIAMELLADSLDRQSIDNAIEVVAAASDRLDGQLKEKFGGETAFPEPEPAPTAGTGAAPPETEHVEGAPEGVGLPPGMEQGEERERGPASDDSSPKPTEGEDSDAERPAAAKHDPEELAGYL